MDLSKRSIEAKRHGKTHDDRRRTLTERATSYSIPKAKLGHLTPGAILRM